MIYLIISLVFVALAVYLLQKKLPNTLIFLSLSLALAVIYQLGYGESAASVSSGLLALDIFEVFREQLISSFASVGLALLPIFGYSMYMDKIKASAVMGSIVAKPVARAKNPYFVGIFIAIVICGVMRIAIVSAFAVMALLFSTLYPAMIRAGLSEKTTMAAIFLGTCFDWGPADFVVAMVLGGAGQSDIPGYFLNASVFVTPIAILVTALTAGFIMKAWDNKEGYVFGSDIPKEDEEARNFPPAYYAILPLMPLLLIIVFSQVFFENVSISVVAAVMISIIISFLIEFIRKRDIRTQADDVLIWITGMGNAFSNLFLMVASIQLFASLLGRLGGFAWLIDVIVNTGVNGWVMFFIIGVFTMLMAVILGEPTAVTAILAGPVYAASTSMGIPFFAAIMPIQSANAFRCLSIGTGPHMQYCCKHSGCTAADIVKRTAVSCCLIYLVTFVSSYFILG